MFAAGRTARGVCVPVGRGKTELRGNEFQDGSMGRFAHAQRSAGMAQIDHLHGNAKAVGNTVMLTNKGKIGF